MKIFPRSPRTATGFTLIELLVVIFIIAILIGLLFPAFANVREQAKKVAAKNDITQIVNAVKSYQVEYQKFPVLTTTTSGTMDSYFGSGPVPSGSNAPNNVGTNDVLFDVLRYNTGNATNSATVATLNPRGVQFLDVPMVHNANQPLSGIVPNSSTGSVPGAWYDPWGGQYNIIINTSYSNYLTNPYSDAPGGTTIGTAVIAYSYGKNGTLGGGPAATSGNFSSDAGSAGVLKGSDDVTSWQ